MKIRELLMRMKKDISIPKTIKYDEEVWKYDDSIKDYKNEFWELTNYIYRFGDLDEEVEILDAKEMCHKCGKYPAEYAQTYCEFCLGITPKKIEKLELYKTNDIEFYNNKEMGNKINEIIDKFNKE